MLFILSHEGSSNFPILLFESIHLLLQGRNANRVARVLVEVVIDKKKKKIRLKIIRSGQWSQKGLGFKPTKDYRNKKMMHM